MVLQRSVVPTLLGGGTCVRAASNLLRRSDVVSTLSSRQTNGEAAAEVVLSTDVGTLRGAAPPRTLSLLLAAEVRDRSLHTTAMLCGSGAHLLRVCRPITDAAPQASVRLFARQCVNGH